MLSPPPAPVHGPAMRPLVNLAALEVLGDDVGERAGYLTINQVRERLLEAGYRDSASTIRRMVDAGHLGTEGTDWYVTEQGRYRMVAAAAVERLINRRKTTRDKTIE